MNALSAYQAASSVTALKQSIGVDMLSVVKNVQISQTSTVLNDFTNAQTQLRDVGRHPFLGKQLNVSI